LRIDQVMTTCLKYCGPIAAFCFIGALGWQTGGFGVWRDGQRIPFINDMFPAQGRWEVREGWTQFDEAKGNDTSESVSSAGDGAEEPDFPRTAAAGALQLVSKQDGGGG